MPKFCINFLWIKIKRVKLINIKFATKAKEFILDACLS